uniref:Uncharacterized protein ALNC14_014390 n=1 Tax=Albugo laibachii Nc14 TaxID=890382 RepID=F0W2L0_9STRA|nr:unnamed protein product [Albugo laibachii Nc14]|eukprot:CCA15296.1 unnamed protein product [Albugo laibachii Nc14]
MLRLRSILRPSPINTMTSMKTSMCSTSGAGTFKLALCQILVSDDKKKNIAAAQDAVTIAASNGANMIALPECWNSPYATVSFPQYAEEIPTKASSLQEKEHPSTFAMSTLAQRLQVYLIGGSIPERCGSDIYNTSVLFAPTGEILGKHRKMHLFDIDVPGKITFKESETLSHGGQVSVCDMSYCKVGVAICYDIRFPELSMLMREKQAKLLIFPGAFNMTTGPAHWELLARARAVDNQLYVAVVSPARNPSSKYQAWGHSSIISPWGEVISTCEHDEAIIYADINLAEVDGMRRNIPTMSQRRTDVYRLVQHE